MTERDLDASTAAPAEGAPPRAPSETVVRPDAGSIARGVWEAPPGAFYAAGAVVLVAALLYGARMAGLLRRRSGP